MAFAGFNSSKFVRGRLQAALYTMRKKNRLARQHKPEPEPQIGRVGVETFEDNPVTGGVGRVVLDRFAMPVTGKLTKIGVHSNAVSIAGSNIKGLVYADAAGNVGDLVAVGEILAVPAGIGWVESLFPDGPILPQDDNFWFGVITSDYQCSLDYLNTGSEPSSKLWSSGINFASPPLNLPDPADADYPVDLCVYAEYTY